MAARQVFFAGVPGAGQRPTRLPLGASRRRISYDRRLRFWLWFVSLSLVGLLCVLVWQIDASALVTAGVGAASALACAFGANALYEHITRPLQTLSNVVAALREDDFSFRARGARRGDSLGDLALEINTLAGTLQAQRGTARDALTLAERVMEAMRTPVLAFSAEGRLRLLNPAAASAFGLNPSVAVGRAAADLGLVDVWRSADGDVHAHPAVSGVAGEIRWSVRRSVFRLGGVPHELFVLSDVQAALREEERVAWQRLVRVLSHEINNSLTPITSLAGSLRARLPPPECGDADIASREDAALLRRGLHLIEDRALSLHRFLQAYQQLTRLPAPALQLVPLAPLIHQVATLETRIPVRVLEGPALSLWVDPVQIEQLLINLLRNAVDAATEVSEREGGPEVLIGWSLVGPEFALRIEDNGPGVTETSNLFVPFYTTKPQGSGIGLALAKQIASGHGGTLTLANRSEGPGCIAELRLGLR